VGYEEGGYLTEHIRRKPYSLILFDEIEKAHPDVFHVMLQILEDGRLTDSHGRTVDFANSLIIMTSNIGGGIIHDALEQDPGLTRGTPAYEKMEAQVFNLLHQNFRPEFLNRMDEIILFHRLSREHLKYIVDLQIDVVRRYLAEKDISLDLSEDAKVLLAEEGYDPAFGARPLKRVIQQKILNVLAEEILEGRIPHGTKVMADVDPKDSSHIVFRTEKV
jgi:ATP-dependent Clp protease ATP-binding subunit ClpA